ncbi:hypothetical protein EPUL_003350 [Erysiphe pulchra]|uniref:Uncharacterized protein n=1 Tax=Erysiphe pulchra TaxID=225359 RepID=A0A2S4PUP2_9PEZI|nr:hypothetical protein EPUL_003350 [Erysiphe pulchra]
MNRFRRRKEARDAPDGSSRLSIESDASIMITTKKAFRLGKKTVEPETKSTIDLATALPSSDNFRTSLLMNGLSARFSMLREQDDPNSKIGKASDDSVMYSKRLSRYNDFGYQAQGLSDIAEISSAHSSLRAPHDIERAASNASLPCYSNNNNSQSYRSVMNRSRPGEGNNLFGGRLKINVGNRVLYDDDVRLSAYQRQRRAEKDRLRPQNGALGNRITPHPLENSNPSSNSNNVAEKPISSTHSEKCDTAPTSTTYLEETRDKQIAPPPNTCGSPEGRTSKIRKLYEAGLDNHLHEQQFSAMTKIDTLTRRTAISGTPSPGPSPSYASSNHNIWNNQQPKISSCTSLQNSLSTTVPSYFNSAKDGFLSPPLTPFENDEQSTDSRYSNYLQRASASETQNFYQSQDKTLTTQRYRKSQDDQSSLKSKNSSSNSLFDATTSRNRTISNSTLGSKKSDSNSYNLGSLNSNKNFKNLLNDSNHSSSSSKDSSQISKKAYSYQESNYLSSNSTPDTVEDLRLHQLNLSEVQPIKNLKNDQLSLPKNLCDPLIDFTSETGILSNSSSSSIPEKAPVASIPKNESPAEIIGMVRQHIRYESNTSSIYESPPSTYQPKLASHTSNVFSQNDYLAQANPWKGDFDDEKRIVLPEETDVNSKTNKEIANLWKVYNDDEKIVVSSEETHVKVKNNKDRANLWKSYNNDEKIVVSPEETRFKSNNNKDTANPWKGYDDDEKIVVPSTEIDVKTKIKKNTYLSPSVRYHIGHYFNSEVKSGEIHENVKPAYENNNFNDENLYLSPAKYDNGSSYDTIETSSYFLDEKETSSSHSRHDSTDTQREQQDLKNELASRRQHVQEKMKCFVESDNNLLSPISIPENPRDGTLKNGVFGILRTKSSWASVKPPKRYLVSRPC